MKLLFSLTIIPALVLSLIGIPLAKESGKIIHDAEHYLLEAQHGRKMGCRR